MSQTCLNNLPWLPPRTEGTQMGFCLAYIEFFKNLELLHEKLAFPTFLEIPGPIPA